MYMYMYVNSVDMGHVSHLTSLVHVQCMYEDLDTRVLKRLCEMYV